MADKVLDPQVLVPYSQLVELMELPKEVAKLKKQIADLQRRMEGNDRIHYDLMIAIGEIRKML